MKINDYDVKIEGFYVSGKGEVKEITNIKDDTHLNITVPLGYGYIAPSVGTVSENTAYGPIKGDIALRFSFLEKKLDTGAIIPKEEWEAIEKGQRDTVQLVMTKAYAQKLIEDLQRALEDEGK